MVDKQLSQEEIDAMKGELAREAAGEEPAAAGEPDDAAGEAGEVLSGADVVEAGEIVAEEGTACAVDEECLDALGEFFNIAMGKAATVLAAILERPVDISTPSTSIVTWQEVCAGHPVPSLIVKIIYSEGLTGENVLVLGQEEANIIASLMEGEECGEEQKSAPLDEYRMGTVAEAMNQMVGGATVSMSGMLNRDINISPPAVQPVNLEDDMAGLSSPYGEGDMLLISFKFVVEGLIESEMLQLMSVQFAVDLAGELLADEDEAAAAPAVTRPAPVEAPGPVEATPTARKQEPPITVGRAEFQPLQPVEGGGSTGDNYQIIMDVELEISVELGRTRMLVKDILNLGEGSIVELDKLVGEPVEIFANGRLVALGEVVVIDEDFGVRITEIARKTALRSELV